jgi:hypothetical protein
VPVTQSKEQLMSTTKVYERDEGSEKMKGRSPFAMVPRELIESGIPDGPFRLWCCIDGRRGEQGYDPFGYHFLAERLGVQTETVSRWAEWLEDHKLAKIDGRGTQKRTIRLLGNPARKGDRYSFPGLPLVPTRHHPSGSRGTAAKRAEMDGIDTREHRSYAVCVGITRATGKQCKRHPKAGQLYCQLHEEQDPAISTRLNILPDKQESNFPAQQETPFPNGGNPLSSWDSCEGVGVGNAVLEAFEISDDSAEEVAEIDCHTGEILNNSGGGIETEEKFAPIVGSRTIGAIRRQRERERAAAA